jgi:hypothetical protein
MTLSPRRLAHEYRNGELDDAPVQAAKQATPKKSRKAA